MSNSVLKRKRRLRNGELFAICVVVLVLIQWAVFVIGPLFQGLMLPFQRYNMVSKEFEFLDGNHLFDNFIRFFNELFHPEGGHNLLLYILRGYLYSFLSLFIGLVSLCIAFGASKKLPFFKSFTNIMLIPAALNGIILSRVFMAFATNALPRFLVNVTGDVSYTNFDVFHDPNWGLPACLIQTYFFALPGSLIFYIGQFNKIPIELKEYGSLDGLTAFQEFIYLGFPTVYPVWALGLLPILTSGLFQTGPGYILYGGQGLASGGKLDPYGVATFAYWMNYMVQGSKLGDILEESNKLNYTYSAAINTLTALLQMAGIFIMKRVVEKKDPGMEV